MDNDIKKRKVHKEAHRFSFRTEANTGMTGFIPLSSTPVDPQSVHLTLFGEEIFPTSFNTAGMPIFSQEAALIYACQNRLIEEKRIKNHEPQESMIVQVTYEKASYNYSLDAIDTQEGIAASLKSLDSFNELCNQRRLYSIENPTPLHGFVIYGHIMLDELGYTRRIYDLCDHKHSLKIQPHDLPEICTVEYFREVVTSFNSTSLHCIPQAGTRCPCCGKVFSADSLKESLGMLNGLPAHTECIKKYEYYKEIDIIIFDIIDAIYSEHSTFELLPNPSIYDKDNAHIPWFLVHTRDGDIKIGHKNHMIAIEWQTNFKPFDIAVFNGEIETVKWFNNAPYFKQIAFGEAPVNEIRGILAKTPKDAIRYLHKAHCSTLARVNARAAAAAF